MLDGDFESIGERGLYVIREDYFSFWDGDYLCYCKGVCMCVNVL